MLKIFIIISIIIFTISCKEKRYRKYNDRALKKINIEDINRNQVKILEKYTNEKIKKIEIKEPFSINGISFNYKDNVEFTIKGNLDIIFLAHDKRKIEISGLLCKDFIQFYNNGQIKNCFSTELTKLNTYFAKKNSWLFFHKNGKIKKITLEKAVVINGKKYFNTIYFNKQGKVFHETSNKILCIDDFPGNTFEIKKKYAKNKIKKIVLRYNFDIKSYKLNKWDQIYFYKSGYIQRIYGDHILTINNVHYNALAKEGILFDKNGRFEKGEISKDLRN